jgi:basic membrane lipoprotein Med (substrate-binding protein (PBP1-ABC) superfamily)
MPRLNPSPRRRLALATLGAAVIATTATLLLLPSSSSGSPKTTRIAVANVSGRPTACLAADSATAGSGDEVAKIWAAMQSSGTGKNIQQLIQPAKTATQAQPYLGSLITQHCDLIITVGPSFGQAVPAVLKAAPSTRFTAIDSGLSAAPTGVTVVSGAREADEVRQQVANLQHH